MTVIVVFEKLNIVVSDILAMSSGWEGTWNIPTTGARIPPEKAPIKHPIALMRKIIKFKIQGNVYNFFVCGAVPHVRKFFETVNNLLCNPTEVPDELERYFNIESIESILYVSYKIQESSGLSCFGYAVLADNVWLKSEDGSGQWSKSENCPYLGKVTALGSGASAVIEFIRERDREFEKYTRSVARMTDEGGVSENNIAKYRAALSIPSIFIDEDRKIDSVTLMHEVGGYYESFTYNGADFEPTDNVVTIFSRINHRGLRNVAVIEGFWFHYYDNVNLIILCFPDIELECVFDEKASYETLIHMIGIESLSLYKVEPLDVNIGIEVIADLDKMRAALSKFNDASYHRMRFSDVMNVPTLNGEYESKPFFQQFSNLGDDVKERRFLSVFVEGDAVKLLIHASEYWFFHDRISSAKIAGVERFLREESEMRNGRVV